MEEEGGGCGSRTTISRRDTCISRRTTYRGKRPGEAPDEHRHSGMAQTNNGMIRIAFPQNVDANHDTTISHGKKGVREKKAVSISVKKAQVA